MLFNTHEFVFLFLPLVLAGYWALGGFGLSRAPLLWLLLASLFFYACWRLADLWILLASIVCNYMLSRAIVRRRSKGQNPKFRLIAGIVFNLALLGYFKYSSFLVQNLEVLTNQHWTIHAVLLPLGISFFTFQQIAFLVEAAHGEFDEPNFLRYSTVVTFFPHLIAGPIINYRDVISQFKRPDAFRPDESLMAIGVSIFVLGMTKKVLLADTAAPRANWVFDSFARGTILSFSDTWIGALSYTLQLYFDFSGYSDMAIGLALLFGIRLPINFNSPYKATNIAEFWRCWHMTLSRFLRDYLYIPLGGNRGGPVRSDCNVMITMLLGGLWHGAGWTFVCWGALHGLYIVIFRTWSAFKLWIGFNRSPSLVGCWIGRALTFGSVVVAWVFFRASSIDTAFVMLREMFPVERMMLSQLDWQTVFDDALGALHDVFLWTTILPLLLIIFLAPNTQEWVGYVAQPHTTPPGRRWMHVLSIRPIHGVAMAGLMFVVLSRVSKMSVFLYFNF